MTVKEFLEFVQKWCHPDYPPQLADLENILAVENEFGVVFPDDYKMAILQVGLAYPTLALLHNIVEREVELRDLSELHAPEKIIQDTKDWRKIGMPENLIAIGNDVGGSSFCFDETDLRSGPTVCAPVYFWDHDFDEVEKVSPSFSQWIGSYIGDWASGLSYKDF